MLTLGCLAAAPAVMAASTTVGVGESIQAAIDAAAPGDVIKVLPGDYYEPTNGSAAIRITKPLKLIAKSVPALGLKVRILPNPDIINPVTSLPVQTNGILVEPENDGDPDVDRLLIKGFTVEGFQNNGIWLRHVRNYKIKNNESIDNLENGIWPTLSANGLVKNNIAYGSQDSALWVEASENVRVIKNELHHAPTGLEVTISKNILMKGNDIHNNTVGVGLYHPKAAGLPDPGLAGDWKLIANHIYDNNEPNSAPPGSMSAELPSGGGILLLGVDNNLMLKNVIENNDFYGIAMLDWCLVNPSTCPVPIGAAGVPDYNEVIRNTVTGNGLNPDPTSPYAPLAAEILYLYGTGNCFSGNIVSGVTIPFPLAPSC